MMKKYLSIIAISCSFFTVQSQGIQDAVRYAQDNLNGTARFRAMSGAFGAVGGDFSSINVNPAGAAIFNNSQVGVTLSSYNTINKADYFGSETTEDVHSFDLTQLGAFFVFTDTGDSNWKKFTLGVNYENQNNFNNSIFYAGTNPNNSIADYFLSYANPSSSQGGAPLNTIRDAYYEDLNYQDQQAFLGLQSQIIKPTNTSDNNDTYYSNVAAGENYQENIIETQGYNGKLSFNAAAQYKDKYYFGLNLNTHFSDYRQYTSFYEDNNNSAPGQVRAIQFDNDLYTYGTGFSLQLGAIAKVTKSLRAGLAYDSPTWYQLNDELRQILVSNVNPNSSNIKVDSDVTILYLPYDLKTPGKFTGSLAYIFGKQGLISVDYSYKDYGNTRYLPENDNNNKGINQSIENTLKSTGELRIGGEYRIKEWRLRGGYRFEQSPYKDKQTMGDLTSFSGGFGYNFGFTKLDFAYTNSHRHTKEGAFSQGFTNGPQIKTYNNNFSVSLLFDL